MDQKDQILTKFSLYISIEKLSDGWPSKVNNFLTRYEPNMQKWPLTPPLALRVLDEKIGFYDIFFETNLIL